MKRIQDSDVAARAEAERLMSAAAAVAVHAHAPYSNFRVGAAVRGASGKIYVGANVENACYGLGTCAERAALAAGVAGGEKDFRAIAIACVDAGKDAPLSGKMPCGACRQWLMELAREADIFIAGEEQVFSVDDLLPHGFSLGPKEG